MCPQDKRKIITARWANLTNNSLLMERKREKKKSRKNPIKIYLDDNISFIQNYTRCDSRCGDADFNFQLSVIVRMMQKVVVTSL